MKLETPHDKEPSFLFFLLDNITIVIHSKPIVIHFSLRSVKAPVLNIFCLASKVTSLQLSASRLNIQNCQNAPKNEPNEESASYS